MYHQLGMDYDYKGTSIINGMLRWVWTTDINIQVSSIAKMGMDYKGCIINCIMY